MDHENSDELSLSGDDIALQDRMVKSFAMLIIRTFQDFKLASVQFEKFMQTYVQPTFSRIPSKTIVSACLNIFKRGKLQVISELSSFNGVISLTCDLWGDVCGFHYVCVSAHYIDSNWMLQKKIISFCRLDFPLNDDQMFGSIMDVIRKYGITDKIFSITFDDHIGNDVIVDKFEKKLQPPHGNQVFFMKCVCQTINSIVHEGLELIKGHLCAIRGPILFIHLSRAREEEVFTLCESQGLERKKFKPDSTNCWNSTLFMLQSCVGYETLITDYYNTKHKAHDYKCLRQTDWKFCFAFMEFLQVFYDATKVFAGVYYPTSCIVLNHMCKISSVFAKYRDYLEFKDICKVMEEKFKMYLALLPPVICLSASVDPRIKLVGVEVLINKISENLKSPVFVDVNVKNLLFSMYNTYELRFGSDRGTGLSTSNNYAWPFITKKHDESCSASSFQTELDMYLQVDFTKFLTRVEFEKLDVLDWWRRHQNDFPVLSAMSRDLLTYPVSTMASASVFRADNRTVSERISTYSHSLQECMFCVKDWEDAKERGQSWTDEMAEEYSADSNAE